jgi:hypothetical protein
VGSVVAAERLLLENHRYIPNKHFAGFEICAPNLAAVGALGKWLLRLEWCF